ncbi:hypothetical protein [Halorubrum trueperi]|uniref:Zinc ribbon domain-containing protein n=1 Tax=Halorubrum trueperi TaxID=2004704 RepID=A0ABD5UGN1_9EURY
MNKHPGPTKDAPLWCKIQQGGSDNQLGYRYIREKILKKTMESAGIDNAYDEMHGLYVLEEDSDEPQVRRCGRCQELNEPGAAFCMRCGFALDQETAGELEEEAGTDMKESYRETHPDDMDTQDKLDALDDLLDDPDVKTALLSRIGVDS